MTSFYWNLLALIVYVLGVLGYVNVYTLAYFNTPKIQVK